MMCQAQVEDILLADKGGKEDRGRAGGQAGKGWSKNGWKGRKGKEGVWEGRKECGREGKKVVVGG